MLSPDESRRLGVPAYLIIVGWGVAASEPIKFRRAESESLSPRAAAARYPGGDYRDKLGWGPGCQTVSVAAPGRARGTESRHGHGRGPVGPGRRPGAGRVTGRTGNSLLT